MLSTYLKKHKDTDSNNMYAVVLFFEWYQLSSTTFYIS